MRSISKFEWRGVDFTGWLFGIHRHVVTDAQRTQCRRSPAVVSERDELQPLEDIVRHDEHTRVRVVFAQLNPKDQDCCTCASSPA